jgi:quercetin dioxygenase-like cupin family protein
MKKRWLVPITVLVLGVSIGVVLHVAIGQQTAPTEPKGVKQIKTSALNLGPQIEEMRSWRWEVRVVQMEPAGHSPMHSHKNRPGMLYVLQGVATEHRVGGTTEHRVGDILVEDKDTTHWIENNGTEPLLFLSLDITKAP